MYQQSILQALQSMFGEMGWNQLSGLTSEDISSAFASEYNLGQQDLPSGMFQPITEQMLKGASYKTYSPQIQAKGQSLMSDLYSGLGGKKATTAAGGFAGSGQFGKQQTGIKDVYGKSMTDTLTQVQGQQTQGISMIQDLINQWHESAQGIAGY